MGRLKPLLYLAGVPVLERSIALFRDLSVDEVVVVLGNRADELRPIAVQCGARVVLNADFRQGMYSSVASGAKCLSPAIQGAFVLPVDVPLVRQNTIRQLAAAFSTHSDRILYPVFNGHRGHPPLIARAILNEAANGSPGPLSALLQRHERSAIEIAVADEAIHMDMDTPSDFDRLQAMAARREIPTARECEAILQQMQLPPAVVRHSRTVAATASHIADALVAAGLIIDRELVHSASMLHDIAKGQPQHAARGAEVLRDWGMQAVATIVAAHMEMEFTGTLDERAIVYLADKLTSGDRRVSLDDRFQPALERFRNDTPAREGALRRKLVAERITAAIEARLGKPLTIVLDEPQTRSAYDAALSTGTEDRL